MQTFHTRSHNISIETPTFTLEKIEPKLGINFQLKHLKDVTSLRDEAEELSKPVVPTPLHLYAIVSTTFAIILISIFFCLIYICVKWRQMITEMRAPTRQDITPSTPEERALEETTSPLFNFPQAALRIEDNPLTGDGGVMSSSAIN